MMAGANLEWPCWSRQVRVPLNSLNPLCLFGQPLIEPRLHLRESGGSRDALEYSCRDFNLFLRRRARLTARAWIETK